MGQVLQGIRVRGISIAAIGIDDERTVGALDSTPCDYSIRVGARAEAHDLLEVEAALVEVDVRAGAFSQHVAGRGGGVVFVGGAHVIAGVHDGVAGVDANENVVVGGLGAVLEQDLLDIAQIVPAFAVNTVAGIDDQAHRAGLRCYAVRRSGRLVDESVRARTGGEGVVTLAADKGVVDARRGRGKFIITAAADHVLDARECVVANLVLVAGAESLAVVDRHAASGSAVVDGVGSEAAGKGVITGAADKQVVSWGAAESVCKTVADQRIAGEWTGGVVLHQEAVRLAAGSAMVDGVVADLGVRPSCAQVEAAGRGVARKQVAADQRVLRVDRHQVVADQRRAGCAVDDVLGEVDVVGFVCGGVATLAKYHQLASDVGNGELVTSRRRRPLESLASECVRVDHGIGDLGVPVGEEGRVSVGVDRVATQFEAINAQLPRRVGREQVDRSSFLRRSGRVVEPVDGEAVAFVVSDLDVVSSVGNPYGAAGSTGACPIDHGRSRPIDRKQRHRPSDQQVLGIGPGSDPDRSSERGGIDRGLDRHAFGDDDVAHGERLTIRGCVLVDHRGLVVEAGPRRVLDRQRIGDGLGLAAEVGQERAAVGAEVFVVDGKVVALRQHHVGDRVWAAVAELGFRVDRLGFADRGEGAGELDPVAAALEPLPLGVDADTTPGVVRRADVMQRDVVGVGYGDACAASAVAVYIHGVQLGVVDTVQVDLRPVEVVDIDILDKQAR